MRPSTFAPLALASLMALLGVAAVAAPATAATVQLSDDQYLAAARCAGLAKGLGGDAAVYDKLLRDQEVGRVGFIADQATDSRENAAREARGAGPDTKARFNAELSGVCHAIAG